MPKKFLIIAAFPVMLIAGFAQFRREPPAPPEAGSAVEETTSPEAAAPAGEPVHHPVSLPVLMEKDFDGRGFEIGETLAETDAYTRYAISYLSGDLKITGIMNVPRGDGPFPVLILNHGYIDPAVYTTGRGLKREQDLLARRGFVVVHPDYRNHAGSDDDPDHRLSLRLGYTEDVVNAVIAIREADLPYADASRVGMLGHSMGGGIAQNVAVAVPDLVDAFVLYAPVSGDYRENFERYTRRREDEARAALEAYGSFDASPRFWEEVSAATYYDRVSAPVAVHIGTDDDSTPPRWSYDVRDRLEAAGKDVALHVYEGEPHEFVRQWPLMMERVAEFFERHLK